VITESDPEPWRRVLEISLPFEEMDRLRTVYLRGFARGMTMPGFRKGHVPVEMVRHQLGDEAEEGFIKEIASAFLDRYDEEQHFPLMRAPRHTTFLTDDNRVAIKIEVEVVPRFELPQYRGLPARLQRRVVTDGDVEGFLRERRDELSTLTRKQEPLVAGDAARIKLQRVAPGGVPLVGENPTAMLVKIDPEQSPPELVGRLIGLKAGDVASVVFPAERGALVKSPRPSEEGEAYSVTVIDAMSVVPPEPAELAAAFGVEDPEELPVRVRVLLEDIMDRQGRSAMRDELLARITRSATIHLPPSLVDDRVEDIRLSLIEKARRGGKEPDAELLDRQFFAERHMEQIRHGLKEVLVAEAIAAEEGLIATREQLQATIDARAQEQGITPKKALKQLDDEDLQALVRRITRSNVERFVEDEADVELAETR
jgi:trigger factor